MDVNTHSTSFHSRLRFQIEATDLNITLKNFPEKLNCENSESVALLFFSGKSKNFKLFH